MAADYKKGDWFHHGIGAVYQIISRIDLKDDYGRFQLAATCYDRITPDGSKCILEGYAMDSYVRITDDRAKHLIARYRKLATRKGS